MRAVFLLLLTTGLTLGQPQRFDQYSYQAPAGYTSQNDPGRVTWTRIDQARKFYCQTLLFASQPSLGSEILRRDLPIPTAPESIVRVAETTNSKDKSRVLVSLYVLRFPGRYVGILQLVPHEQALEACQPDLAPLLPSLSLSAQPATRYNTFTQQLEQDPVPRSTSSAIATSTRSSPTASTSTRSNSITSAGTGALKRCYLPPPYPPATRAASSWVPTPNTATSAFTSRTPTAPGTRFPLPASDHRPRGVR